MSNHAPLRQRGCDTTASRCAVADAPGLPPLWLQTASSALPRIARAVAQQILSEVPEYRADPDGTVARDTRQGVHEALSMFMKSMAWGMPLDAQGAEVFRRLGRREARAGRSHDTLQRAYRVASQAVMAQLLVWERENDAPREVISALSSAVFDFIDDLAHLSAEGYGEGRVAMVDAAQARSELLALLVCREGFARRRVADAARRAGWSLPAMVTVVEIVRDGGDGSDGGEPFEAGVLGVDVLLARVGDRELAVVPGTVRVDELRERVAGSEILCVVGPTVALVEAASSARLAQRLRARHDVRARAVGGVIECDDHLVDVLLDGGRDVAHALVSSRLTPLAALSPGKRLKYGRLLSAWLEYGTLSADAPGVLDKHRQTLRYQTNQLEHMFGDALRERTARLELMLALRAALPLWERQAARCD